MPCHRLLLNSGVNAFLQPVASGARNTAGMRAVIHCPGLLRLPKQRHLTYNGCYKPKHVGLPVRAGEAVSAMCEYPLSLVTFQWSLHGSVCGRIDCRL